MRYFFHIGYQGSAYRGWQRQPDAISVQEVLEDSLEQILKRKVYCIGCGRTDAEVHASQYFFHLDTPEVLGDDLKFICNKVLPEDIAVYEILPVEGRPHAQFDASQRTYDYFIHTSKNPFLSKVSALYPAANLQVDLMQQAIALLPQYTDYRAFCKTPDRHNSTLCEISEAKLWIGKGQEKLRFRFTANRFLRGMIRMLVGNIMEIGKGRENLAHFEQYLRGETLPRFTHYAYPQGLYLSKVAYPFLERPVQTAFPEILQSIGDIDLID